MIRGVTGVNLRETGVRGTNRSHVGKGAPVMPQGLLCEKGHVEREISVVGCRG